MSLIRFVCRVKKPPTPEEELAMSFADKIQIIALHRPVAARAIERFMDLLILDMEELPPKPA